MAEPELEETHIPETNPTSFFSEFDSIAIIPSTLSDNFYSSSSDQALLGNSISDLRFFIDGDDDFDLNFDSVDDLYCSSENESLLSPVDATNREMCDDFKPESRISGDSDCSVATIASPSHESGKLVVDEKLKVEEEATTKRKKEIEEDTIGEFRNNKYRRSEEEDDDEKKKNVRLIRNRECAKLSRRRKKHYVEELEDKVKNMHFIITDLNSKISYFMAENSTLRQQVSPVSGLCRPRHPPAGLYPPLAPMPYPWMQFPAYMVKPQVQLLPIPRLKPQQSMAKVKKTKKVASVSVLGLLFCLFLLGALAPIVSFSYGGISKVLDVNSFSVSPANGREPLVASLYVPRNEKLVKIDGSLIIHSILASDSETNKKGSSVAIAKGTSHALPLPDNTRNMDMSKHKRKALSSSGSDDTSKDRLTSTTANCKMQQWFREGVAGPLFSSGMCTEVFQFDASSTSGAIKSPRNTTDSEKGKKNRRILRGGLTKENLPEIKPTPSMVVSVLVDTREGGDGETDGMMRETKSLSKIFIVVLVDGVKYVTYSCVLPRPQVPHLVTT